VLATNRLEWDVKIILETYLLRWNVDAFYRDSKEVLGLEDYEVRKLSGMKRQWLMVFLADTFLQLSPRSKPLVEYVKNGLENVSSTCRYAALEVLRSFVSLVMRLAQKLKTADDLQIHPIRPEGNQNVVPNGNLNLPKFSNYLIRPYARLRSIGVRRQS
jgi:hypothetical protein